MGYDDDRALLVSLLSRVQGEKRPEETADLLLKQYGSLQGVAECIPAQSDSLPVPQNTRTLLAMLPGLCRMRELDRIGAQPFLGTLSAASRYAQALYIGAQYEQICLICLDEKLRLRRHVLLSEGGVREVPFYPRKILQEALGCGAKAVILCHNHLSGWCFFSDADVESTREFLGLCRLIHLPLLDHLLIAGSQVSSMRSKVYIPESDWRACGPLMPTPGQWRSPRADGQIEILPDGPQRV